MAESLRRRNPILLIVVAVTAVALAAAVCPRLCRLFAPSLDDAVSTSSVYLPLILKNRRLVPDSRFGIAEHGLAQMLLVGFPDDGRYHSVQHRQPEKTDTVRFLRPASRDHHSTWLLGTYDTEAGRWVDETGFRRFVRSHDGMIYVVGNEPGVATPVGDNNVSMADFARWYRDAWNLIKAENPTALVGPFAPVNADAVNRLRDFWGEYQALTGGILPVDFFPIHHHVTPGAWMLAGEIARLTEWIDWLNDYEGRGWEWTGAPNFWLTEYSLSEWSHPGVNPDDVLRFMGGFTTWLKINTLDITVFVWWPSGRHTNLIHGTTITPPGEMYLRLALQ